MSDKGSVFQKGGGGTNFEQSIQAAFLVTLITGGSSPCLPANEITEVSFQNTNKGYETDDLLVAAKSVLGKHKLLIQIKHDISFTEKNEIFKDVLRAFWKDYNKPALFDKTKDKLLIVKNGLTKDERNHFKSLFNWANSHATDADFFSEVNRIQAKRERLNIIRDFLKEANENVDLSDNELWIFLKCMDVLEYDFLQTGSVDQTYFLNLIRLSKNKECHLNEKEIWDSTFALAAILNKDGGNVTQRSIKETPIYKNFAIEKLIPHFKDIEKLKKDSTVILNSLKNTIGDLHLTRESMKEKIVSLISLFPITIVTGAPGVGKSAQIKDILQSDFKMASVFTFRADQFSQPHIANVFSGQGVDLSVLDIFSCISLIPEKILFVDSLEKLLEADPECAFKQLIAIISEYPDIRLIATSRKYAIDLIVQKFDLNKEKLSIIDLPNLSNEDLEIITARYSQLRGILKNVKIRPLLSSPKYLDFSVKALQKSNDDYSNIELENFKSRLWNILVVDEGNIKNGLPIKRENAFMEIAVKRAKEMKLFTQPINVDAEAVTALVKDEILVQENFNRRYAPAHDILEDWALVKYISSIYDDVSEIELFFNKIGKEPAIRRAFRLWIEELLIDENEKVTQLIQKILNSNSIEQYWADEILTAVFRSNISKSFFSSFENELLKDDSKLFIRCLQIIKTCCKENSEDCKLLLPTGSGWGEALFFIENHIDKLSPHRLDIVLFFFEWRLKLIFQYNSVEYDELLASKSIVLYYIKEAESGLNFWQESYNDNKIERLAAILFDLAEVAEDDIRLLVESSFKDTNGKSWELKSFYRSIRKQCLKGIGNYKLIKQLPDLLIESAWKEWRLRPIPQPSRSSILSMIADDSLSRDKVWGIEDRHEFFPSGIFKTPIYNLFYFHPHKALTFFIDFLNYSVDFYVHAKYQYKQPIEKIEFELEDKMKRELWSSQELWSTYRGITVTNYLLESLLMSFEKFLLDTADVKTDASRAKLKSIFDYVYKYSNNIAPLSVMTSVAIAYPNEVNVSMLPLLKIQQIYHLDLNRAIRERTVFAPMDQEISFAQEERWNSNQLPHRRKFIRGFSDFILDYQFNIRTLNPHFHQIFDELARNKSDNDIVWKKTITEIDIRNHKLGEYDEKLGGFSIIPDYDDEIQEFMESGKGQFEENNQSMHYSTQLINAYENKKLMSYSDWQLCKEIYTEKEFNIFFDRPITLAVIGLRDFPTQLNKGEKEWCINTVAGSAEIIIKDTLGGAYGLNANYNIMEKMVALSSFHLLFNNIQVEEERDAMLLVIVYMLISPFAEHEIKEITKYIREDFFNHCPKEAMVLWSSIIQYAEYKKLHSHHYNEDEEAYKASQKKQYNFIKKQIKLAQKGKQIFEIAFDKHDAYLITRALLIIPFTTDNLQQKKFIEDFIALMIDDFEKKDSSDGRDKNERKINYKIVVDIKYYLAELIIAAEFKSSKFILSLILQPNYGNETVYIKKDWLRLTSDILELSIYKVDELIGSDINKDKVIKHFWEIWGYLFTEIKEKNEYYFIKTLFLDIQWNLNAQHWLPLEGKKKFYHQMVLDLGSYKIQSILNVLSTIGEKTFLPDGLIWIVEILKNHPSQLTVLMSPTAERLANRLFYNHISVIIKNKQLVDDFVWLLNKMVEFGSSSAYLFRENLITYKTIN